MRIHRSFAPPYTDELFSERACTRGKIERMFYVNFDEHITMKYGIVIEGWPFPNKFMAPGKFSSVAELRVLLAAWESGTTYFRSMSNSEWQQWAQNHRSAQNSSAVSHEGEEDNFAMLSRPPSPSLSSSSQPPAPLPPSPSLPSSSQPPTPLSSQPPVMSSSQPTATPSSRPTATSSATPCAPTLSCTPTTNSDVTPAPSNAAGRKRARSNTLNVQFFNAVTAEDGSGIQIPKRARKERSDKNTKRGPRKKRNTGQENMPPPPPPPSSGSSACQQVE